MGYEPLPAYRGTNLFGKEALYYPNVFRYRKLNFVILINKILLNLVKYVYKTDGFLGLYRGFGCSLLSKVVCWYTTTKVDEVNYFKFDNYILFIFISFLVLLNLE
jgi:hypothetical protein